LERWLSAEREVSRLSGCPFLDGGYFNGLFKIRTRVPMQICVVFSYRLIYKRSCMIKFAGLKNCLDSLLTTLMFVLFIEF
jgi:hypothetical protein